MSLYVFFFFWGGNSILLKYGEKKKEFQARESRTLDQQDLATIAEEEVDEFVTMATVRKLLKVQESMLKTLFESVVQSLSMRVDKVVKSVQSIKTS